ncbi:MAG: YHS domain-containing protein [Chlorobi bacterium]|nr:YHS domain-containing protein [Chlorobiota bacterium]
MKPILAFVLLVFMVSACGQKQEAGTQAHKTEITEQATEQATEQPSGETTEITDATPVNKYCMVVSEHEVDPKVTLDYKGTVYGFCCEDCIPKFKKDPEKYISAFKKRNGAKEF